jgi:XTP/dITP diphosphohydrolase
MNLRRCILASNNQKKLAELQHRLGAHFQLINQASAGVAEAEENGLSFVENALIKARHASEQCGLPAIADDSGLEVDYLEGKPGIYSSRYAGPHATDEENVLKLLAALESADVTARTARFHCVIVLMRHSLDPVPTICQGRWEGTILHEPRGSNGFGYDPIFYVPTHRKSAAQLTPHEKNHISHRAKAIDALLSSLS